MPPSEFLQVADLREALRAYGGAQSTIVAQNPKLLKATFDLLKAAQSGNALGGVTALASGASSAAGASAASQGVRDGTRSASFVMSTFKATMDLANVARLSGPGAVGVFVGATAMHKTGLAVSLAGGDSERAKCIGAVMELAGSATVTALTAPTGVLLVLSLASLTASTYNAHLACQGALSH